MKVLVLGTGKMGCGVTWDLIQQDIVESVGLVDIQQTALEYAKERVKCAIEKTRNEATAEKIVLHRADVTDTDAMQTLMSQYDVGVLTLSDRRCSYKAIEAAIEAGLNVVDILEEYHRRPDSDEIEDMEIPDGMTLDEYGESLHQRAVEKGILLLDGMGFAPGLSNVTLGEGIRKLDHAESAIARVGGIPAKEIAEGRPLRYVITWAFAHVLREYMVKVKVIKNGRVVNVDATGDREPFRFTQFGHNEELVCAITPGMPSFIYTRSDLREFAEKTIRWPGHWAGIETLKECGMLDLEPINFEGMDVSPREFLHALLEPRLKPANGEIEDICVMWNTVSGISEDKDVQIDYYMWEKADGSNSAMARVTAFPAAIAAVMVGKGLIPQVGIIPPEDAIVGPVYEEFMLELQKRDIKILEVISSIA